MTTEERVIAAELLAAEFIAWHRSKRDDGPESFPVCDALEMVGGWLAWKYDANPPESVAGLAGWLWCQHVNGEENTA